MKNGELPAIPSGPQAGKKPVIAHLIDPALAPGMDKVIANLEIRPPQADDHHPTTLELAAAKQLASDLANGQYIEEAVRDKIHKALTTPEAPKPAIDK